MRLFLSFYLLSTLPEGLEQTGRITGHEASAVGQRLKWMAPERNWC